MTADDINRNAKIQDEITNATTNESLKQEPYKPFILGKSRAGTKEQGGDGHCFVIPKENNG